ncbi:hypothetical protein K7X08_001082 [Anisodus acutangulus]|uniref:Uncharacterized protein n=1 Tax=Anisodus acutangulus TaxID=402998 RepID=A0A9Q1RN22_9SOLA|nr:hypothetical protein K7X08_001082 [Anisodus acutangulus]
MGLQTDMYPSHGLKQQQSYYNDNDYYSSEENYYSNNGSSMQMTRPYGYPSVTTPQPTQHHHMIMSHDQTGNGHYDSHGQAPVKKRNAGHGDEFAFEILENYDYQIERKQTRKKPGT